MALPCHRDHPSFGRRTLCRQEPTYHTLQVFSTDTGELIWSYRVPQGISFANPKLALDSDGIVYLAGTELPRSSRDDLVSCTGYGCSNVVLRAFDREGSMLWDYHHYSQTAEVIDLTASADDVALLIRVRGEAKHIEEFPEYTDYSEDEVLWW